MENLALSILSLHEQRTRALLEEAKIERYLAEKKRREANHWQQRRLTRNHKLD